jgi:hypothetical protein
MQEPGIEDMQEWDSLTDSFWDQVNMAQSEPEEPENLWHLSLQFILEHRNCPLVTINRMGSSA